MNQIATFAKKITTMKTLSDNYSDLERLLNEEHVFLNTKIDFTTLCSWLGVGEQEMNAYVFQELGLSGDELLLRLRQSMPGRLGRKYGIIVPEDVFF